MNGTPAHSRPVSLQDGISVVTTSSTWSFSRWAGVLLFCLFPFLYGCHSEAYKAATLLNAYDFRENRYEEKCLPYSTQPFCATAKPRLDAFRKHAQELAKAVQSGGSAKLQLDLVTKDAAGVKDVN